MKTNNTPFTTDTFQNIWKKHFKPNKSVEAFEFIEGVKFYKGRLLPLFFNVGKNLTKGNNYVLNDKNDYKNKVFVIYDILPHLQENNLVESNLKICKSPQYPGFLINLDEFENIEDYLLKSFSKNTRMKMRKFNKRLSACFRISEKMFFGHIDKHEYDDLFDSFMCLLKKRYSEKRITYNNMQPAEWAFYKEVAYPLIVQKKASLFVIYDNKIPIAITYNYHSENEVTDAITVFDTDYSKFNIGYVNNLRLLNWCFQNHIKSLDFSKGYFDYKKRMCTLEYNFEYHVMYDKKSITSKLIAYSYYNFLELKTFLRNKKLDVKFHKFTYKIMNLGSRKPSNNVEIKKIDELPLIDNLEKINIKKDVNYSFLSRYVNDFLYLVIQPYNEIESYKAKNLEDTYYLSSDSLIHQVRFLK